MGRAVVVLLTAFAMLAAVAGTALAASTAGSNVRFMNWPERSSVIHIGVFDDAGRPGHGTAFVPGRSSVLFGFEWAPEEAGQGVGYLSDTYIDNPDHDLWVSVDGGTMFSVTDGYQAPFVAVPGVGPRWEWDHDGDGLGDGNGNGVGDFEGAFLFWRWEVKHLTKGTHTFEFSYTLDGGTTVELLDTVTVEVG